MPAKEQKEALPDESPGFLRGTGSCGDLVAGFAWEQTPLGPIAGWPASLRTAVALVLNSPAAMSLRWGPDGYLIYNQAFARIIGERHPAALGRELRDTWPESEEFNVQILGDVRDERGQPFGVLALATEAAPAERALAEEVARNRQILDSAIDYAIIAFDLDGHVTRWNEGAHRLLGWTEAEMLGQDGAIIFTPEDRAHHRLEREELQALAVGMGNDERWHMRKSGERFWASGELTPIHDERGQVTGFVKVLRDRTEQHVAAEALRQSEERLRRAQSAGGVGTFTVDLASNTVTGTDEFFGIFGIYGVSAASDPVPVPLLEALVLPEDLPLIAKAYGSGAQELSPAVPPASLNVEYRIRRASDDRICWIARKADYERDAEGRTVRLLGVVQDITERKAAQRALEQSEAQFRSFAQALPNHVWTAPPDGLLDWFNDRVLEYSGLSIGELVGRGWTQLVHHEDVAGAATAWAGALTSGEDYETEFRVRRADGSYRWHLVRAVPIRASDGALTRWVGTNTDIHERKLAEAQTAENLDRIWSSTNDLMATASRDGILRSVNPAWMRLLGHDGASLIGKHLRELTDAEGQVLLGRVVGQVNAGRPAKELELQMRHQGGQQQSWVAWAIDAAGEMLYMVGRNVTEQRSAEDTLRQALKMEAVGQLTGGIAHDFNNLLQGITGSLSLIKKLIDRGRAAETERFIGNAMNSAARAAALTHRLLAFSRRQPLDPRPVEANPLVTSMEDLLRRTLGEQIKLDMRLNASLWLTRCDPNQLENAILNLAINSRDAMPHGGMLIIETSNAVVDKPMAAQRPGVDAGRYVCLSVTDTGAGMKPETVGRAFEPFFTTKPIGQGTGLGLSMIYGFARQSGGYAQIYSELGKGTTVKLYLPQYRGDSAEPEEPLPEPGEAHGASAQESVLVVEDEDVVRELIVAVLNDLGYQTLEAVDGPSGLAVLQGPQRIDLLVTDVGLPGLNGRQLADAVRLSRPAMKVLFMTGYAENATMAAGFLEPGMAMITKPFAIEAMAAKIREILNG